MTALGASSVEQWMVRVHPLMQLADTLVHPVEPRQIDDLSRNQSIDWRLYGAALGRLTCYAKAVLAGLTVHDEQKRG